MGIKAFVQSKIIDPLQFRYDIFPRLAYQPLPWIGQDNARRSEGSLARWEAIQRTISGYAVRSALDIGCNVGYFSFSLANKGFPTLGVDSDDRFLRIARYAARRIGANNVGFSSMLVSSKTANLLPDVDLILLLSVWHHWVKAYGLDDATELLARVWGKCAQLMFFETGEDEMPVDYGLPAMEPTPAQWLEDYLAKACPGSTVTNLGQFKAFAPGGDNRRLTVQRNLFVVARERKA